MARRSASVLPWYHWNMYSRCRHFSQVPQSQDRGRPTLFTAPPSIKRDVIVALKPGGSSGLGERLATRISLRSKELHVVCDDAYGRPLLAFLRLPGPPAQTALHGDLTTLGEVLGAVLALRAEDVDIEVVGPLAPLAGRGILGAFVHRQAEPAHAGAAGHGGERTHQGSRDRRVG